LAIGREHRHSTLTPAAAAAQKQIPISFAEFETVHSLDWIMPLDWRHQLNLFAAYTESEVALGGGAFYEGEAIQVSGRYLIPLNPFAEGLFHELTLGVDYKRSDFGFILGSQQIPTNLTEILQFSIQYSGGLADEHGQTAFGLGFVYSPGDLLGLNDDEDFQRVDPRGDAQYAYTTVYLRRTQTLPKGWTMFGQVNAQHTDDVLLTSEQVSIGGYGSVRGYQERVLLGDEGAWASFELRSPVVRTPISKHLRAGSGDQLQGILFVDAGWVRSTERLEDDPSSYHIWSLGTGLRYQLGSHISLRADLGLPLKETELKLDRSARLHFGLTGSF